MASSTGALGVPAVEGVSAGGEPVGRRRSLPAVLLRHRLGLIGIGLIAAVALFSFVGPLLYRTDQIHANINITNEAPSGAHLLGTDGNGFDILGRLMVGGQLSLELALAVALAATVIGALYGSAAGMAGGVVDSIMMRFVDMVMAIPAIFILIFLADVFHPTLGLLIVTLALLSWPVPSRLVRAETLSLREREFVEASRASGGRLARVIFRHILPNTVDTIVVNATFQVADAVVVVAALSFLGFGLPPPSVTWGGMLTEGYSVLLDGYWWEIYPVLVLLCLTVLAFNFVGEALRDTMDVRLEER